ncbi:unnamed protein product [Caretta caretta]
MFWDSMARPSLRQPRYGLGAPDSLGTCQVTLWDPDWPGSVPPGLEPGWRVWSPVLVLFQAASLWDSCVSGHCQPSCRAHRSCKKPLGANLSLMGTGAVVATEHP